MRFKRLAAVATALLLAHATPGFAAHSESNIPEACDEAGQPPCTSDIATPEAAVMALMATGMVGLTGVGLIRRRRQ